MNTPCMLDLISVSARVFGTIICLPIGEGLQTLPRLLISICFGVALAGDSHPPTTLEWHQLPLELFIGTLLALPTRIFIESLEMLGEILDTCRGQTISSINDPLNGNHGSDMASLFRLSAIIIAIYVGAFEQILLAVKQSYTNIPVGLSLAYQNLLPYVLRGCASTVSAALALSSVWLLVYLISDLMCALFSKTMHGLQFTSMSAVIKMVLTFVLLGNAMDHPHDALPILSRLID